MKNAITELRLKKALMACKWIKVDTAELLGISETALHRLCRKYKIDTEEEIRKAAGAIEPEVFKIARTTDKSPVNIGSFVVIPDVHGKDYDRPCVAAICAFIKDFKPEVVVQLGDIIDNTPLMAKVKQRYPSFDEVDLKQLDLDYFYANEVLDQIDRACSVHTKKVFLPGNHEYRSDIILGSYPHFDSLLNYKTRLRFKERGWDITREYLQPLQLGKLNVFHGEFWGASHVRKHITHYRRNLMYGHTHQVCQDSIASPMQEIPTWAASIGCVTNVNPDWQRGKSNCWEHGFAYGWWDKKTGDFDPVIKRIVHGKFHAEGKLYIGGVEK